MNEPIKSSTTYTAPDDFPSADMQELFEAILSLKNKEEAAHFFRDLLTAAELKEFANRWQMVKHLLAGEPYSRIATELKTSTATVTRVAHWLNHGAGGYKIIAERSKPIQPKIPEKSFKLRGKRTFI